MGVLSLDAPVAIYATANNIIEIIEYSVHFRLPVDDEDVERVMRVVNFES